MHSGVEALNGGDPSGDRRTERRPFKPSMLARAYHIATLLNPVESAPIKHSQTIKEVVNRIV
jgi:hypothetical protein